MLSAIFLCLTKLSLSQGVTVEVIGRDTFPLASIYNGTPVSIFTDSQTTTLAQLVSDNQSMRSDIQAYKQKEVQYESVAAEMQIQINTLQLKLNDAMSAGGLATQNEDDLKQNLKDAAAKYKALKIKSGLRIGLGTASSFLVGTGIGALIGFLKK